jgi:CheY-like chemotaxis protein
MKKILVIEDEARSRDLFLECLKAKGFYTIGAENGLLGVMRAQEQLPDLVICDIVMPELDGYGVLTTLRQNPVTAIIPFIFLTGSGTKAELRKGMELGANDYLTKPCTLEELLRAIAAGADSLMIEVHPNPAKALSDGPQSLTPEEYQELMHHMAVIGKAVDRWYQKSPVPTVQDGDRQRELPMAV